MRTLDSAKKKMDRDEAWDLIPWYVNSTLSDDERLAVEDHLAHDPALRAEMASQTRLAEKVTMLDTLDVELERSLGAMRQRIRAETPQAGPPVGKFLAAAKRVFGSVARFEPRVMLPLGAAAAVSLAAVLVLAPIADRDAPYRTLTAPATWSASDQLRVKARQGAAEDALQRLFSQHDLTVVDGPSPTGVYTLALSGEGEIAAVAEALALSPEIEFATARPRP